VLVLLTLTSTAACAQPLSAKAQARLGNQLLEAAKAGDVVAVGRLIDEGASHEARGHDGETALIIAARYGYTYAVAALLQCGAAVDAANDRGSTALMAAASGGRTECARLLLEAGADTAERTKWCGSMCRVWNGELSEWARTTSAWQLAEESNHPETAALLVERLPPSAEKQAALDRVLRLAARKGRAATVAALLRAGAAVDGRWRGVRMNRRLTQHHGVESTNALTDAANAKCARLLLEAGADVWLAECGRRCSLLALDAAATGRFDVGALLLERAPASEDCDKQATVDKMLRLAIRQGHGGGVAVALQAGAAVDSADERGNTPLIDATSNGQTKCAWLLLRAGADATLRNHEGHTALDKWTARRQSAPWSTLEVASHETIALVKHLIHLDFEEGDRVTWTKHTADIPAGTVGNVQGASERHLGKVVVAFPAPGQPEPRMWAIPPDELNISHG